MILGSDTSRKRGKNKLQEVTMKNFYEESQNKTQEESLMESLEYFMGEPENNSGVISDAVSGTIREITRKESRK